MNIFNFEKQLTRHQLRKGLDYFNTGSIISISKSGTAWNAVVGGTEPYKVKITLTKDTITQSLCNCPHDVEYCKHVIAVLYYIQKKNKKKINNVVTKKPMANKKTSNISFSAMIKKITEKELRDFIIQFSADNSDFRNIIQMQFGYKTAASGYSFYSSMLSKAIDEIVSEHRFIGDRNISGFMKTVRILWAKAEAAFKDKEYDESIDISLALLEHVHHVATCLYGRYEEVWKYMGKAFVIQMKIAQIKSMDSKKVRILNDLSKKLTAAYNETNKYAENGQAKYYALDEIDEYKSKLARLMVKP